MATRICREAGGRVRTNMLVRDMDLDVPIADARRLEVVVDGLPLHRGAQLAVDTTLVCALHADGRPRGGRWSEETRVFLSQLASARARSRRRGEQAWRLRWGAMWACAVAKAVPSSLRWRRADCCRWSVTLLLDQSNVSTMGVQVRQSARLPSLAPRRRHARV